MSLGIEWTRIEPGFYVARHDSPMGTWRLRVWRKRRRVWEWGAHRLSGSRRHVLDYGGKERTCEAGKAKAEELLRSAI